MSNLPTNSAEKENTQNPTHTHQPLVSIVVPVYRRREDVLSLLHSVYSQNFPSFEVIVVDDCGIDGTVEAIEKQFPQTICLSNPKNMGPAYSRNRGILASRGTYVIGLDSDVTISDEQLIKKTVEAFEESESISGFAFRIMSADASSDDKDRWWHPYPIATFSKRKFDTTYISGTGYAFRRADLLRTHIFPEILFMHYEEVGLCLQLINLGYTIRYNPDLCVNHKASPTSNRTKVKTFYKPRNQILLCLLYKSAFSSFLYLIPRISKNLFDAFLNRSALTFIASLVSAMQLAPKCLELRAPISKDTERRIAAIRHRKMRK